MTKAADNDLKHKEGIVMFSMILKLVIHVTNRLSLWLYNSYYI